MHLSLDVIFDAHKLIRTRLTVIARESQRTTHFWLLNTISAAIDSERRESPARTISCRTLLLYFFSA